MIEKLEIDAKAEELGVHTTNVQRDYVFGRLLSGIYQNENSLRPLLVLKGGNCFRKAYFEHSRFSNDLDFSVRTELDVELFVAGLKRACEFAKANSGVEFLVDECRVSERLLADAESHIYEARIYFKSFYAEEDVRIRVDLDVREHEQLFLPTQTRRLIHSFSDAYACNANIHCVKLEELLASKLKALLLRRHSPDLYDFVHAVFFQKTLNISRLEILTTFLKQTIYGPEPMTARRLLLELPFQAIKGFWNEYLVCPRASLFSFDDAEAWFKAVVAEIFALSGASPVRAGLGGGLALNYFSSNVRAEIMEAARLNRIVKFFYDGLERKVEPYSLTYKRRADGVAREYFYAWDLLGGRSRTTGLKSYTGDKIRSITITEEQFQPRVAIELVKSAGYFAKPFGTSVKRAAQSYSARKSAPRRFTIACHYCDKTFARESMRDTKLNPHKDRYGNRCHGIRGYFV